MAKTTLKVGSKGEAVKKLQKSLGIKDDGIFGKQTEKAVKDYQSKNKLVSDGIAGNKTLGSLSGGSTKPSSAPSSKPKTIAPVTTKKSTFANPFAGGFFKNVAGGLKSAKSSLSSLSKKSGTASALQGKFEDTITLSDGSKQTRTLGSLVPEQPVNENANFANVVKAGQYIADTFNELTNVAPKEKFSTKIASASEPVTPTETSSTMDNLVGADSTIEPDKVYEADHTAGSELYNVEGTNNVDSRVADTSTQEMSALDVGTMQAMESAPSTPNNANILNKINALNTGLKSDSNNGTAWMSSGSKSEFQNGKIVNYASNVASNFNTPEEAVAFYKTPEGIKSLPEGVKPEDIISKVTPVTNGVVGPQSTPEYLTKLGSAPGALAGEKKVVEQQMNTLANFATDYEKTVLGQAQKDRDEAITLKEALEAKELREEATIRDRAELTIDKLKAEQKAEDAEIEINRVQGKANLTEFLAKIGALRTDGNAQLGLETLEAKYQSMRLANKNSYKFAIREAQIDMSEKINKLESETEEKIIDINSDLSKSEREINLDVMKLRFDTQMKGLDYVSKFQDSIKTENEKARTRSEKVTNDYTEMMWKLMVNENVPEEVARTMFNGKQFQYTGENANIIKQYGAKQAEPKPDYKGEVLNLGKGTKVSQKIYDATGLGDSDIIQLQKELQQGYTLEQIAKNNNMPTSIYNALRPYVSAPNK